MWHLPKSTKQMESSITPIKYPSKHAQNSIGKAIPMSSNVSIPYSQDIGSALRLGLISTSLVSTPQRTIHSIRLRSQPVKIKQIPWDPVNLMGKSRLCLEIMLTFSISIFILAILLSTQIRKITSSIIYRIRVMLYLGHLRGHKPFSIFLTIKYRQIIASGHFLI